jgi:hypothetical protein
VSLNVAPSGRLIPFSMIASDKAIRSGSRPSTPEPTDDVQWQNSHPEDELPMQWREFCCHSDPASAAYWSWNSAARFLIGRKTDGIGQ